jgi:hypothetical protein
MKRYGGLLVVSLGILIAACAHSTDTSFTNGSGGGTGGTTGVQAGPGSGGFGGSTSTVDPTTTSTTGTASTTTSTGSAGGCVAGTASEQQCTFTCMNSMKCGQCQNNACVCVDASMCGGTSGSQNVSNTNSGVGSFISGIGAFISGIGSSSFPSGSGGSIP